MKPYYSFKKMVITVLTIVIVGCGAETVAALIFIPAFSATWNVENDPDYRIDLQPDADNKNVVSGVFEGEELHDNDNDRNGNPLSGSFNGLNIEFTIVRDNNVNIKYSGIMRPVSEDDHTIVRIELNSPQEGNLVLVP